MATLKPAAAVSAAGRPLIARSAPLQLFFGTSVNFLDFLLIAADTTDVPSKSVQTSKPIGRSGATE
ncbi:MAG TPA: hypothetical protein DC058_20400 [Planctomycetaceae bacterium]|nr:hypothetical protein [Planctomycetaceae bacterium]HBC63560.1 hypothetical protein [Planctomycetaceae bacterium]